MGAKLNFVFRWALYRQNFRGRFNPTTVTTYFPTVHGEPALPESNDALSLSEMNERDSRFTKISDGYKVLNGAADNQSQCQEFIDIHLSQRVIYNSDPLIIDPETGAFLFIANAHVQSDPFLDDVKFYVSGEVTIFFKDS